MILVFSAPVIRLVVAGAVPVGSTGRVGAGIFSTVFSGIAVGAALFLLAHADEHTVGMEEMRVALVHVVPMLFVQALGASKVIQL